MARPRRIDPSPPKTGRTYLSSHNTRAIHPDEATVIRLSRHQAPLLREALTLAMREALSTQPAPDRERHRRLTLILRGLPAGVPYDFSFYATEWPLISKALRPGDSHLNPTAGTPAMRYRALYSYLLKHQGFRIK